MKVLVLEDDTIALDIVREYLRRHGFNTIDHSPSILKAKSLLDQNKYDLVLLDIHLEDGDSTDLIDFIPSDTKIIFTTSDKSYAIQAFEMNAVDYLVKPIEESRFTKAMNKVLEAVEEETILIKADYLYHKINVSDIYYIKSNKDYLTLYAHDDQYTFYGRIKNFIKKLPESKFRQCHRSYIINLDKVETYSSNELIINAEEIPVSNGYKKEIRAHLKVSS